MKKYGLIGFPLKHSFSQRYFTQKFTQEEIESEYLNFEIPDISMFKDIVESNSDLCGLNVTIPYKEQVIQYLDNLDDGAKEIGAVNVVKILRTNGSVELIGYNSDIVGFQNSISCLIQSFHKKALVLGTGGASKAVVQGLKNLGIEPKYVSRTLNQGAFLYEELNQEIMEEYTVIVNASPIGTFPDVDNAPSIPYHFITDKHLLYDLVYNPSETMFLKLGASKGAKVKNGAEMLELQAEAAWEIWNQF